MSKEEVLSQGYKEFMPNYYINKMGLIYSMKTRKLIKPRVNMNGYLVTEVSLNGKRKIVYNHIKVVEVFGDKNGNRIYPGLTNLLCHGISIDHLDENKTNPCQSNLELVAHKLNCERRSKKLKEEYGIDDELGF